LPQNSLKMLAFRAKPLSQERGFLFKRGAKAPLQRPLPGQPYHQNTCPASLDTKSNQFPLQRPLPSINTVIARSVATWQSHEIRSGNYLRSKDCFALLAMTVYFSLSDALARKALPVRTHVPPRWIRRVISSLFDAPCPDNLTIRTHVPRRWIRRVISRLFDAPCPLLTPSLRGA
jgi:hypothetical protein